MPCGKAIGINREYQVTCRDVLMHRHKNLMPLTADGIDVAFELPDTTWSFDVALTTPDGSLVVAECRRTRGFVKQKDVAGFAWTVERLRETTKKTVSAHFFTKTGHQIGAVRVGAFSGIQIAVLDENAKPPGFNLIFLAHNANRTRKLRNIIMHVPTGVYRLTGSDVTLTYVKNDGTIESR